MGGILPEFSYNGYAARLLTAQEINTGCGFTIGSYVTGELSTKCKYLMENTQYLSSNLKTYGWWLESPITSGSYSVWISFTNYRRVNSVYSNDSSYYGVRPAIEVQKSNISY